MNWIAVVQRLKRLPPMQETRVRSLGREDPLEKEMVTHSSILAWRIPWTEKPGRLQSTGAQSRPRLSDPTSLAPLLCPFICQRAFELSPCPGCCQYCCTEHWAACVFVNCNFVWILGLPRGHSRKESACQCRRHKRWGFDPWARKIPGVGHGSPLHYSCLGNTTDRGASRATVRGITKTQTWLSD